MRLRHLPVRDLRARRLQFGRHPARDPGVDASVLRRVDFFAVTIATVLAAVGVATALELLELNRAVVVQNRHATPGLLAAQDLSVALVDEQSALRGYALTGRPSYLTAVDDGTASQVTAAAALDRALSDDPSGRRMATVALDVARAWRDQATTSSRASAVTVGSGSGPASGSGSGSASGSGSVAGGSDPGGALFGQVQSRLGELRTHLLGRRAAALDRAARARDAVAMTFAVGLAACFACLIVARRVFRRSVAYPLAQLASTVSGLSGVGDGDDPRVAVPGAVEVVAVATEIEALRTRLRAQVRQVEADNAVLRQRNVALVELRARLTPRVGEIPGFDVAGGLEPAEGVLAGDWFDLRRIDTDAWCLVMVDVSGHGAEAGILALQLKQLLLPVLADGRSPGAVMAWALAHAEDWGEHFATALVVVGSLTSDVIQYANAGHPPPVIAGPDGVRRLEPTGPLLSPALADLGWHTATDRLRPGERLVAYTDGVVEARSPAGDEFGDERFEALAANPDQSAAEVVAGCVRAVREFQNVAGGRDDCTVTVIQRTAVSCPAGPPAGQPAGKRAGDGTETGVAASVAVCADDRPPPPPAY